MNYTPEIIQYICDHYNRDMRPVDMAPVLGISRVAIAAKARVLRAKGYDIPKRRFDGGIRTFTDKRTGATYQRERIDGKWKYVKGSSRQNPNKAVSSQKPAKRIKDKAEPIEPTHDTSKCVKSALSSRHPTKHTRSRNPVENGYNPATVKTKADSGGRYVKTQKGTWVYKKYDAA